MFVPLAKAFAASWAGLTAAEREVIARFLNVSTEAMRTVGADWAPHEGQRRR